MRDAELVERFLAGDPEAVETVSDWVRASAWPFRRRMRDDWDDGVQEALTHVVDRLGRGAFEGRSSLKTWVWRLTGYRFVDRFRRKRARPTEELDARPMEPESPADGPLETTLDRERWRRASRILGQTSEGCRELWSMLFEGLDRQAMAARLAIREGTLRVRLHRCRQQAIEVRGRLEREEAGDDRE